MSSIKDIDFKYLDQKAKDLKMELGLYKRVLGSHKGTGKYPYRPRNNIQNNKIVAELNESINDVVKALTEGYGRKSLKRLEIFIDRMNVTIPEDRSSTNYNQHMKVLNKAKATKGIILDYINKNNIKDGNTMRHYKIKMGDKHYLIKSKDNFAFVNTGCSKPTNVYEPKTHSTVADKDFTVERVLEKVINPGLTTYYVIKGRFGNEPRSVYLVTSENPQDKNRFTGASTVELSEQAAKKTAHNFATIEYLQKKYGKQEGYKRWMRGETDKAIKDTINPSFGYATIEFMEGGPHIDAYRYVMQNKNKKFTSVAEVNNLIKQAESLLQKQKQQQHNNSRLDGYFKLYIDLFYLDKHTNKYYKYHGYRADIGDGYEANKISNSDIDYISSLLKKEYKIQDKLIQSGSKEALQKNIKTEIESGKDPKQAAAIAYSVQRKNDEEVRNIKAPYAGNAWKVKKDGTTYIIQSYEKNSNLYEIVDMSTQKRLLENVSKQDVKKFAMNKWGVKLLDKRVKDAVPFNVKEVAYKEGDYSILRNKENPAMLLVVKGYKGENPYMGSGTIEFTFAGAQRLIKSFLTIDKLNKKYGQKEGYKRWMEGKTDKAITDYKLPVTVYVINKGQPSQYFGLKNAEEGTVLQSVPRFKTIESAKKYALTHGYDYKG